MEDDGDQGMPQQPPAEKLPIYTTRLYNTETTPGYTGSGTITLDLAHDELLVEAFAKAINEDHFFRKSRDINQTKLKELLLQKAKVLNLRDPVKVVERLFGYVLVPGFNKDWFEDKIDVLDQYKNSTKIKEAPSKMPIYSNPNNLFFFDIWDAWLILTSFNSFIDSGSANAKIRAKAVGDYDFETPIFFQQKGNQKMSPFPFTAVFNGDVLLFSYILEKIPEFKIDGSPAVFTEAKSYKEKVKKMNVIVMNFVWQQNLIKMFQDIMQDNDLWKGGRTSSSQKSALAREKFLMSLGAMRRICFVDYNDNGTFRWKILLPTDNDKITIKQITDILQYFNGIFTPLIDSYYKSLLGNTSYKDGKARLEENDDGEKNLIEQLKSTAVKNISMELDTEKKRIEEYFNISQSEFEAAQGHPPYETFPFIISQSSMAVNIIKDITPDMFPKKNIFKKNSLFGELFSLGVCSFRNEVKDIDPTKGANIVFKTDPTKTGIIESIDDDTVTIKLSDGGNATLVNLSDIIILDDKKHCVKGLRDLTSFFMKNCSAKNNRFVLWNSAVISSTIFQIAKYSGDTCHIIISLLAQDARDEGRKGDKIQQNCDNIREILVQNVSGDMGTGAMETDPIFYNTTLASDLKITLCLKERPMAVRTTTINPPIDNLVIGRLSEIDSYLGTSGVDNGYTVANDPFQAIQTLILNELQIIENAGITEEGKEILIKTRTSVKSLGSACSALPNVSVIGVPNEKIITLITKEMFKSLIKDASVAEYLAQSGDEADSEFHLFLNILGGEVEKEEGERNEEEEEDDAEMPQMTPDAEEKSITDIIEENFKKTRKDLLNKANINEAVKKGTDFQDAIKSQRHVLAFTKLNTALCESQSQTLLFPFLKSSRRWSLPNIISDKSLKKNMAIDNVSNSMPEILNTVYGLASIFPDFALITDVINWSEALSKGKILKWDHTWNDDIKKWVTNSETIIKKLLLTDTILSKPDFEQFVVNVKLRRGDVDGLDDNQVSVSIQTFMYNLGKLYKNKDIKYTNDEVNELINIAIRYSIGIDLLSNLQIDKENDTVKLSDLPVKLSKISEFFGSKNDIFKQEMSEKPSKLTFFSRARKVASNIVNKMVGVQVGGMKESPSTPRPTPYQVATDGTAADAARTPAGNAGAASTATDTTAAAATAAATAAAAAAATAAAAAAHVAPAAPVAAQPVTLAPALAPAAPAPALAPAAPAPAQAIENMMQNKRKRVQTICMQKALYTTYSTMDNQAAACLDTVNRYILNIKTNTATELSARREEGEEQGEEEEEEGEEQELDSEEDSEDESYSFKDMAFAEYVTALIQYAIDDNEIGPPKLLRQLSAPSQQDPRRPELTRNLSEPPQGTDKINTMAIDVPNTYQYIIGFNVKAAEFQKSLEIVKKLLDFQDSVTRPEEFLVSLYTNQVLYNQFEVMFNETNYINLIIKYFAMYSQDIYPEDADWFFPELHIVFLHIFIFGYDMNDGNYKEKLTYIQYLLQALLPIHVSELKNKVATAEEALEAAFEAAFDAEARDEEEEEGKDIETPELDAVVNAQRELQHATAEGMWYRDKTKRQRYTQKDALKEIYDTFTKNVTSGFSRPLQCSFRINVVSKLLGTDILNTTTAITNAEMAQYINFSTWATYLGKLKQEGNNLDADITRENVYRFIDDNNEARREVEGWVEKWNDAVKSGWTLSRENSREEADSGSDDERESEADSGSDDERESGEDGGSDDERESGADSGSESDSEDDPVNKLKSIQGREQAPKGSEFAFGKRKSELDTSDEDGGSSLDWDSEWGGGRKYHRNKSRKMRKQKKYSRKKKIKRKKKQRKNTQKRNKMRKQVTRKKI